MDGGDCRTAPITQGPLNILNTEYTRKRNFLLKENVCLINFYIKYGSQIRNTVLYVMCALLIWSHIIRKHWMTKNAKGFVFTIHGQESLGWISLFKFVLFCWKLLDISILLVKLFKQSIPEVNGRGITRNI